MGENANPQSIEIGKLLSSAITGFSVGTSITNASLPRYGALVRTSIEDQFDIYGLIYDIRVDEDGLIRQLATTEDIRPETERDNRRNRNVPLDISVLTVGYKQNNQIFHMLPSRPPLSLNRIYMCSPEEIIEFTGQTGRYGYFRHVLRNSDLPISELLATHIREANQAHNTIESQSANPEWARGATQEIIAILRNDYEKLTEILSAISDAIPDFPEEN